MKTSAAPELRLPCRCRSCGAPLRLRITPLLQAIIQAVEDLVELHPDGLLETYQCSSRSPDGRTCNSFVEVTVQDMREAHR